MERNKDMETVHLLFCSRIDIIELKNYMVVEYLGRIINGLDIGKKRRMRIASVETDTTVIRANADFAIVKCLIPGIDEQQRNTWYAQINLLGDRGDKSAIG